MSALLSAFVNVPAAADRPDSVEAMAARLRSLAVQGGRCRIVGAGSLAKRTAPPPAGARLITTVALNARAIDAPNLVAHVGAGCSLRALDAALAEVGLIWPVRRLEPGGTVGGTVASGRGAGIRPADAPARRWVLGAQVVTGAGRAIAVGGATVKNSSGYHVAHALWGSNGVFGAIARLTLRLRVRRPDDPPEADASPALAGVLRAPVQVRCEELPSDVPSRLLDVDPAVQVCWSGDRTRALAGCEDVASVQPIIAAVQAAGGVAWQDVPPTPFVPSPAAALVWRALRDALDPAGLFV